MPYVSLSSRDELSPVLVPLEEYVHASAGAGELNYIITRLVWAFWRANPRYATIATITGVLENVKQEIYRRVFGPYEDRKIEENGDVYVA